MPEAAWKAVAELDRRARPTVVRMQPTGVGLIALSREPEGGTPEARLRGTTSVIARVTASKVEPGYQSVGWVVSMDCTAEAAMAVVATLRPSGVGSDYRLIRSENGGKSWEPRGTIPAPSLAQLACVGPNEAWALGANWLGVTVDGGTHWDEVKLGGERNPSHEKVVRDGKGIALLTRTGASLSDSLGVRWVDLAADGLRICDFQRPLVAAQGKPDSKVGAVEGLQVRWTGTLPPFREPLRITAAGSSIRVLSRAAQPERGVDLQLHRSEDQGRTFDTVTLGLRAEADIEGEFGLGLDLQNRIFGRLA